MANEAVCIETPTIFERKTCADGAGIAIGTILQLSSDANTVTASSGDSQVFGGIAWEEKTASDGVTEITVAMDGTWDMKDSGAGITLGGIVSVGGTNLIKQATEAEMVTGDIIGKCHETAAGAEVVRIKVGSIV
jgi:hypothetical protein